MKSFKLIPFTIYYLLFAMLSMPALAWEIDTSIDEEIRKNYNPSRLEEDQALPVLPKILNSTPEKQKSSPANYSVTKPSLKPANNKMIGQIPKGSFATIKEGTKIRAKLLNSVSDRTKRGTQVEFVSRYPVSTTYFTIPMGTVFRGEIVRSHRPQLGANGGLIVIKVKSIIIDDSVKPIDGNITEVNYKKVFFNNIKGKQKYLSSMINSMKPGFHFLRKMTRVSGNLITDGSSAILSPFSMGLGILAAAGNVAISPVIAVFHKGGSIYLPAGSQVEIKLTQDVFIYN